MRYCARPMRAALLLVLALAGACHGTAPATAASPVGGPAARDGLNAFFRAEWEHRMREWPTRASSLGDRRFDDRWPDVSPAGFARRAAYARELRARVRAIDPASLTAEDRLNLELFAHDVDTEVEGEPFRLWHLQDDTAFIEGWAHYAESLGDDMGLYDDSYAKLGQLAYEMWRAVRLVVDTGMHAMHWDRQRAIDYFLENTPKTALDATNEIDRSAAWPGQALAYKIGQLEFRRLRDEARSALRPRFDVKAFHDVVLREGALPLDVLAKRVEAWVAETNR